MPSLRTIAAALILSFAVQLIRPAGSLPGPAVAAASTSADSATNAGPWWWSMVTWLVVNCITSYESGSWYDRVVCRRAARFIGWLLEEGSETMCLRRFYEVVDRPTRERRLALYRCLIDEGLPAVNP